MLDISTMVVVMVLVYVVLKCEVPAMREKKKKVTVFLYKHTKFSLENLVLRLENLD
jgi:hypothetical protein